MEKETLLNTFSTDDTDGFEPLYPLEHDDDPYGDDTTTLHGNGVSWSDFK